MHYYKINVSDWQAATRHLTPAEEGVYIRLINHYYDTEKPIPLDTQPVTRRLMLSGHKEIVASILSEFFEKTDRGYVKSKCEELIKEYKKNVVKNKRNGAKGGRPKKDAASRETQSVTTGNPDETQVEPKHNPNQEPLTTNQEPKTSNQINCPHGQILELYNRILPECTSVITNLWNGQRKKDLQTRWKENEAHQKIEFWEWYFSSLRNLPFYLGTNDRGWKADLGWLVKQSNFNKTVEKLAQ